MRIDMTKFDTALTKCVHGGDDQNVSGHVSSPICLSTAFVFPDTTEGARRAADIAAPEFYGRWGSRNSRELERLIAALEGAEDSVCASSGLAIVSMIAHAYLKRGDHFVASHNCYSEVKILLEDISHRFDIECTFIRSDNIENFANAIRPNTRLVFTETPANPTLSLVDISAVSALSKAANAILIVDSTFASPINQNPLMLGADIVMHSATKYIGGHSDVVAGVCAGSKELLDLVRKSFSFHGPHLDPFAAWLLCRGIRTLALRMKQHSENGLAVAQFLENHPNVSRVWYPFLESHPQYAIAKRQMRQGGGMVCFELKGGMEAALKLISNVTMIKMAVSLGGFSSTITHPASMTHNLLPKHEREKGGITDGMIRFSVGIEYQSDIIDELTKVL
jgi:methionine-gamma-lyase